MENPFSTPQAPKAQKKKVPLKADDSVEEPSEERYFWLVDIKDKEGRAKNHPDYDPRTLYIPPRCWDKFTPFERQYWEIKTDYFDTVVFFKKGKFYELYETDADIGSKEFDLKMTDRVNMRMAGIPEASFEFWAAKFIAAGHKVAKVDQMETSIGKNLREKNDKVSKADKIIKRSLSCILTAGTLMDPSMIAGQQSNFCLSIKERQEKNALCISVCLVDTSTCSIFISQFEESDDRTKLSTLLAQTKVKEIFIEKGKMVPSLSKIFKRYCADATVTALAPCTEFWDKQTTLNEISRLNPSLLQSPALENPALSDDVFNCFGSLIWYLRSLKLDQQIIPNARIEFFDPIQETNCLVLDHQTLVNLEIFQNSYDNSETDSLFSLIDQCVTPFGKRLLRQWVCHPLKDDVQINKRLDCVESLLQNGGLFRKMFE